MSIREDLQKRAGESTVSAALRAGRTPVIALLHKYGATRASSLSLSALVPYIEEVEALPAADVEVPVEFKIGERVRWTLGQDTGTVVGYEVLYVLKRDGYNPPSPHGYRGDKLESLKTAAIPEAPAVWDGVEQEAWRGDQWTSEEIKRALKSRSHFNFVGTAHGAYPHDRYNKS